MYHSPIDILTTDILHQIEKGTDEEIYKAVVSVGINVDKDELLRALRYDRQQYQKGYLDGLAESQPKWISVEDRLPESGVHVLVACEMDGQYLHGQYVCDGYYADRYTHRVENTDYDIACEYCEEDDEYYLWQGWYEVIKNWDDYNSIVIGDTVTHWMPLPLPPKEGE